MGESIEQQEKVSFMTFQPKATIYPIEWTNANEYIVDTTIAKGFADKIDAMQIIRRPTERSSSSLKRIELLCSVIISFKDYY